MISTKITICSGRCTEFCCSNTSQNWLHLFAHRICHMLFAWAIVHLWRCEATAKWICKKWTHLQRHQLSGWFVKKNNHWSRVWACERVSETPPWNGVCALKIQKMETLWAHSTTIKNRLTIAKFMKLKYIQIPFTRTAICRVVKYCFVAVRYDLF